VLVDVV
jgi:translation initiation factor 3 subunit C